jgi:hypothetical protein
MASVPGFAARFAKLRWKVAWDVARWLFRQGRDRLDRNLTKDEQRELWGLMRESKGRRANLSSKQRERFVELTKRGVTGRG